MSNDSEREIMQRSVVCIGVFDGVHLGHQYLVSESRSVANRLGAELIAVTFNPHPLRIVHPAAAPQMIGTLEQRKALLLGYGVDQVHVINFTAAVSEQSSEEFVTDTLVGQLNAGGVVVGENFTFGHRASGNVSTLRELGKQFSFEVTELGLSGGSVPVSSSRIRAHIRVGEISQAEALLGHGYRLCGEIVLGDQRGRTLGYPTANLQLDPSQDLLVPAEGVYAGFVHHGGDKDPAAISVGTNPQFQGVEQRIEAYILDRHDVDLYGQQVEFEFSKFLRGQQVFSDLEAYLGQMALDVQSTRKMVC